MTAVSGPLIRAPILTSQRANYAAQALPAAEGRRARRLRRKVDLTSRARWEETQTVYPKGGFGWKTGYFPRSSFFLILVLA